MCTGEIACLLLYEDYVWVSLGHAMQAKQSIVVLVDAFMFVCVDARATVTASADSNNM
jgi:hypothetical protein